MADIFNNEKRSEIMRKVKSKKNKSTELRLIDIFKQNGITGWKRNYPVKGHPDFVFLKEKVAVFVDGCFWHGHDCRNTRPAENKSSWGALMEVGAAWITQVEHKIFNIYDFRPEHPLDDEQQWHSSSRDDDGNLYMSKLSVDIFAQKIEYICDKLGYKKRTRQENKDHLSTLVQVTPR